MELIKITFTVLCTILTDTAFLYYAIPFICAAIIGFIILLLKGCANRV